MRVIVAFVLLAAVVPAVSQPSVPCGMKHAFDQTDADAPGGTTPVWTDPQGNLLFIERLNVNTDGTRRSYSVEDFWGEHNALNNLCNAMSDACKKMNKEQLRARRIATQEAARNGWPKEQLKQTRLSPHIIPMPDGKPCPAVDGYLVSATALHAKDVQKPCELSNYVDALTVPAIVIPKGDKSQFAKAGARVGDLVTAVPLSATRAVHGVIGDTGPQDKLGEASLAMNGALLGKTSEPVNYLEVRGRKPFEGKGWAVPKTLVLIFAKSRDVEAPYLTLDRIGPAAEQRFQAWGGLARARACAAAYAQKAGH